MSWVRIPAKVTDFVVGEEDESVAAGFPRITEGFEQHHPARRKSVTERKKLKK